VGALWAFVGVAALVIVTPGPDTALTVRNALLGGRGAGVATAVAIPARRPPSSALRTVSAVSGPGVTITRAATPTNAHSAPIYKDVPLIDCWPRATL